MIDKKYALLFTVLYLTSTSAFASLLRHPIGNVEEVKKLMNPAPPLALGMPPSINTHECYACHAVDAKKLGPSWMTIADKYRDQKTFVFRGKTYSLKEGLITKSILGGAGNFGTMPTPGYGEDARKDIEPIIDYVLKLATPPTIVSIPPAPKNPSAPPLPK